MIQIIVFFVNQITFTMKQYNTTQNKTYLYTHFRV